MSKQKSYVITDVADAMAAELAEANGLGKSNVLEILIRQAHASKWTVISSTPPTPAATSGQPEISLATLIGPKEARVAVTYDIWSSTFAAWHKKGLPRPYTLGDILAMHERLHPSKADMRLGAVERVRQYINATKQERSAIDADLFALRCNR